MEANLGYLARPSCFKITKQLVGRISGWTWWPAPRRRRDHRNSLALEGTEEPLTKCLSMYAARPGGGEG